MGCGCYGDGRKNFRLYGTFTLPPLLFGSDRPCHRLFQESPPVSGCFLFLRRIGHPLRIRVTSSHIPQKSLDRVLATPAPAGGNSFDLEGHRPSDPAGEEDASRSDASSQNPRGSFVASACTAASRGTPSSLLQFDFSADFVLLFAFVAHNPGFFLERI